MDPKAAQHGAGIDCGDRDAPPITIDTLRRTQSRRFHAAAFLPPDRRRATTSPPQAREESPPPSILRLVHQRALLDPRHHVAQFTPTSSIGCCASLARVALNEVWLTLFSSIQSRANLSGVILPGSALACGRHLGTSHVCRLRTISTPRHQCKRGCHSRTHCRGCPCPWASSITCLTSWSASSCA